MPAETSPVGYSSQHFRWLLDHLGELNESIQFYCAFIFPSGSNSKGVKYLPTTQETQVRFLSREDPLEKGMANHSSVLAWEMLWTEEPGGLQSVESQRVGHDGKTSTFIFPSVK